VWHDKVSLFCDSREVLSVEGVEKEASWPQTFVNFDISVFCDIQFDLESFSV
jgi:hypothetical protein